MNQQTPPQPFSDIDAAQAFAALGSEQRLSVLRVLVRAGPEGLSMGVLSERTGIAASTLTHHIRFLSGARLVSQSKVGRSVICAAASFDIVERLARFLIAECCADATASDPASAPASAHAHSHAQAPSPDHSHSHNATPANPHQTTAQEPDPQ